MYAIHQRFIDKAVELTESVAISYFVTTDQESATLKLLNCCERRNLHIYSRKTCLRMTLRTTLEIQQTILKAKTELIIIFFLVEICH